MCVCCVFCRASLLDELGGAKPLESHPALLMELTPVQTQYSEVRRKAVMRLQYDGVKFEGVCLCVERAVFFFFHDNSHFWGDCMWGVQARRLKWHKKLWKSTRTTRFDISPVVFLERTV